MSAFARNLLVHIIAWQNMRAGIYPSNGEKIKLKESTR